MLITTGTLIQKSSKTRGPRFPMRSATSEKVKSQLGTTKVTRTVITTKTAAEAAMVVETKMAAKTTKMAAALAALVVVVTKTAANTTNTAAEAVAEVTASLPIRTPVDPISGSTCNTKVSFHRNPSKVPRTGWIPGAQLRCSKSSTKIATTKSACVNTRTRCTAPRCSRSA